MKRVRCKKTKGAGFEHFHVDHGDNDYLLSYHGTLRRLEIDVLDFDRTTTCSLEEDRYVGSVLRAGAGPIGVKSRGGDGESANGHVQNLRMKRPTLKVDRKDAQSAPPAQSYGGARIYLDPEGNRSDDHSD